MDVHDDGADFLQPEACAALVEAARSAFGRLEVLVNSAGQISGASLGMDGGSTVQ